VSHFKNHPTLVLTIYMHLTLDPPSTLPTYLPTYQLTYLQVHLLWWIFAILWKKLKTICQKYATIAYTMKMCFRFYTFIFWILPKLEHWLFIYLFVGTKTYFTILVRLNLTPSCLLELLTRCKKSNSHPFLTFDLAASIISHIQDLLIYCFPSQTHKKHEISCDYKKSQKLINNKSPWSIMKKKRGC
jgi:hypothetical protein